MNSLTERSKGFIMQRTLGVLVGVLFVTGCGTADPAPCQLQSPFNGGYAVRMLRTAPAATGCDTLTPEQIGDLWIFDVYETDPTNIQNFTVIGYSTILGQPPDPPNSGSSPLYGRAQFTTIGPAADNTCILNDMTMNRAVADPGTPPVPPDDPGTPGHPQGEYQIGNFVWLNSALYLGTEFKGDVVWSTGACSAQYSALAIDPPVQCESDADCDPFGQPFGSGINPDYDQNCVLGEAWTTQLTGDDTVGICFFQKEFPSTGGYQQ
jgi:hypothetical protein